jgi:hypothetical protein
MDKNTRQRDLVSSIADGNHIDKPPRKSWIALKIAIFVISAALWIYGLLTYGLHGVVQNNHDYGLWYLCRFVPFCVYALLIHFDLSVFYFSFSLLGWRRRTLRPAGEPLNVRLSSTRLGNSFSCPIARFTFLDEGVEVKAWPTRSFFLPWNSVVNIKKSFWGSYEVTHSSPEFRSPIFLSRELIDDFLWAMKFAPPDGQNVDI